MELNKGQNDAVFSNTLQTLVLAGAGTGKTRVIINRIEQIINQGVPANKIVATTFTNKAAAELKARLSLSVGDKAFEIICGTFHKISAYFLKLHGSTIGISSNFQILNEDDQRRLVKRLMKETAMNQDIKPQKLIEKISKIKEQNVQFNKKDEEFKKFFEKYQDELLSTNYLDYSDLIQNAIFLFEKQKELTATFAEHVMIDEYQDINLGQYNWIKFLSAGKNLFCVGDEDQAIYSFRGSSIEYIQKFHHDFPDANIVKLEENYRSGKEILKHATNLIDKNPKQFKKILIPGDANKPGIVKITKVFNEYEEAKRIAKIIALWKEQNADYKIGILVRTKQQIFSIEQGLVEAKIPYEITSGKKFYLKKEVQDLIAYLKIIVFPHDFLAFSKIINSPKRNIGDSRLQMLLDAMKTLDTNFENALTTLLPQLPKNAGEKCKLLLLQIQNWRSVKAHLKLEDLLEKIISETGYTKQEDFSQAQEKTIDNLKEQIKKFNKLEEFLENIEFSQDQEENNDVQIMTMHASKGLEFDVVIAPGWEENVFPSMLAKDRKEIEEERRLAYVTITRAKEVLEILYTCSRRVNGQYKNQMPSRFLFDLD